MSRKDDITGKSKLKGNKVSHSNKKTNKHWKPNLRKVKVIENGAKKTVTVSMKTYKALRKGKIKGVKLIDPTSKQG